MLETDTAFAGVGGQADLVRRGDASARELAELALARIERLDPELNAFGAVYPERALAEADAADRRRAAGEDAPLLGVPVGIKDEIDLAGEVTSRGSGANTARAAADAESVRRLRAAGAVVVGKTTMPELGLWPFTESLTWGVTRNPWDAERTPGGSSGGSAAAVAAGIVPFALAADGAGSIRIPAACCGLFGLKPQRGRVSLAPRDGEDRPWIVYGPLTRSVRDTALVLDVLADPLPGDPPGSFAAAAAADPGRLRIAVSDAFPVGTVGRLKPEVRGALAGTAELLRSLGHEVADDEHERSLRDVLTVLGTMFRGIRDFVEEVERPQRLERRSRAMARPGALVSERSRGRLLAAEQRMAARIGTFFEDYDVIMTPVMSEPAVRAGLMQGRGAIRTFQWESSWVPFEVLWNSTGQPAASVPAGFSDDGLPLAVQLVGRPGAEATLLSLAAQLEAARPWAERRPPVS